MNVADIRRYAGAELATAEIAVGESVAAAWAAVAAVMSSVAVESAPRECGAVETIDALIAAGVDPSPLQVAMEATANGRFLLSKLATVGVAWGHRLTQPVLAALVSAEQLSQAGMDALMQLSAPVTYPFGGATAAVCKAVIAADALERRIRNATALANERISPDDTPEQQAVMWAQAWAEGV